MIKRYSTLFAVCAVASLTSAAEPITLDQAIARAIETAPALESASANVEAALAGIDLATANRRPQIGLRGEVGALETDFTNDQISQVPRSIGVQGEWVIYASGALSASAKAADFQRQAAQAQLMGTREQTVLEALESYSATWLSHRTMSVARERVETFEIRFEETSARFEQGQVTRTDIALTEARLGSAQAELQSALAALAASEARLSRLTGLQSPEPVGKPELPPLSFASFDQALASALKSNPNLSAAQLAADAAESRLAETKGQFGPKVSLKARATHGEDVFFFFEDPISDIGAFVQVDVPLFTGGQRSASERRAYSQHGAALANARLARLQVQEAVSALWYNVEARRAALSAARRAERAAQLAAEGTKREFDAGVRTLVDSLDAETDYQNSRIATFRAEIELLIAKARLISLAGTLEDFAMSPD